MLQGPQTPVAITQLRRAGYTGEVIGMSAMGSGNLKPAGQVAKGAVWPTDFTADQTAPSSVTFVQAYQAKYGDKPNNYAAEGYDAMWFLARGIKQANSADRAKIQAGLAAVAKQGFDGAMGKLTFDGNDVRVPGSLATWNGSAEGVVAGVSGS
jgi:branched-chain amino acid transport system substrate-binding protein